MKEVVKFVKAVLTVSVVNDMKDIEKKLITEIHDKQMRQPVSFVVMNKNTHDLLLEKVSEIWTSKIDKITKYQGLDVFISEDVFDNEFKIG